MSREGPFGPKKDIFVGKSEEMKTSDRTVEVVVVRGEGGEGELNTTSSL